MQVGVIKEIKDQEHRVALTPAEAQALHQAGHTVLVQAGAGLGSGFSDRQYRAAGPYVLQLAHHGLDALRADPGFGKGVNTFQGFVTSKPVAEALGLLAQYKAFAAL
jgi:alanine dehydrogenase